MISGDLETSIQEQERKVLLPIRITALAASG